MFIKLIFSDYERSKIYLTYRSISHIRFYINLYVYSLHNTFYQVWICFSYTFMPMVKLNVCCRVGWRNVMKLLLSPAIFIGCVYVYVFVPILYTRGMCGSVQLSRWTHVLSALEGGYRQIRVIGLLRSLTTSRQKRHSCIIQWEW